MAMNDGDYEYALRIYQRLADMGSEAAAWNAERLSTEMGLNASDWFDLQVQMNFGVALHRLAEKQIEKGDVKLALKTLSRAAKKEPGAAFSLGWSHRKTSLLKTRKYMDRSVSMKAKARLPVTLAWLWIFLERLPIAIMDYFRHQESDSLRFVSDVLRSWHGLGIFALWLIGLYILIAIRVRISFAQQDAEDPPEEATQ
jgi:tetratricopeptide (TPR) repeat protein